ncbi:hypothetical protein D3C73_1663700 [compost metagenome]
MLAEEIAKAEEAAYEDSMFASFNYVQCEDELDYGTNYYQVEDDYVPNTNLRVTPAEIFCDF